MRAQAVFKAASLCGGIEALALRLGTDPQTLRKWIDGAVPVPAHIFVRASELITDAALADAAKQARGVRLKRAQG